VTASSAPFPPAPAAQHPRPRDCPAAAVQDALLLLDSGRPGMARRVLEALPEMLMRAERERLLAENRQLRDHVASLEAGLAQRQDLQARLARLARELADLKGTLAVARQVPAKPLAKRHEILATALANGAVTAQRVATLLRVDPAHVFEIASGRIGLAPPSWKKLFSELEVSIP